MWYVIIYFIYYIWYIIHNIVYDILLIILYVISHDRLILLDILCINVISMTYIWYIIDIIWGCGCYLSFFWLWYPEALCRILLHNRSHSGRWRWPPAPYTGHHCDRGSADKGCLQGQKGVSGSQEDTHSADAWLWDRPQGRRQQSLEPDLGFTWQSTL